MDFRLYAIQGIAFPININPPDGVTFLLGGHDPGEVVKTLVACLGHLG